MSAEAFGRGAEFGGGVELQVASSVNAEAERLWAVLSEGAGVHYYAERFVGRP